MPPDKNNAVSFIGMTNVRHPHRRFGIKQADRLHHVYVIGKTGTGKSTLLETLIHQDIASCRGCALLDPHGDLVERIFENVPEHRREDVIYVNLPDRSQPYGYNPLRHVREERRSLAASGMLSVMQKMWPEAWGVRMEHILRNALLALLEQPDAELPDILRLLTDRTFRRSVSVGLSNAQVRMFWQQEFEHYSYRFRADSIAPIQNKVGAFLADPTLYRVVVAPQKELSFRRIMDEEKVLLVNLAKGQIGEDAAGLLGGLLVTTIGLAAFSRADRPESERPPFFLYLDEFQNSTTRATVDMISELRKFNLGLILSNQYLHQLNQDVREAVLGNAGTLISFRLGAKDAAYISRELQPRFSEIDLLALPNYEIYLKLMIDGMPSVPFSARTLKMNA